MDSLPTELLTRIVGFRSKADLATTRLVNGRFNQIASSILFSELTLYAHYFDCYMRLPPWPLDYDAQKFKNVVNHGIFRPLVKKVCIYTCEPHADHNVAIFGRDMGEFPNLQGLTIIFDRHVAAEQHDMDPIFQDQQLRHNILNDIINPLKDRIRDLWIRSLSGCESPVSGLRSLRLSVVHEETEPDLEPHTQSIVKTCNPHTFWAALPARILAPSATTLTHLVLYSSLMVGWYPKLDFRLVFLPNLKTLSLGMFLFFDDHQIDWIVSHRNSLRALYLDHCAIRYQVGHTITDWLDPEGYITNPQAESASPDGDEDEHFPAIQTIEISLRWHNIFDRLAEDMNLREFRFGTSEGWNFEMRCRFGSCPRRGIDIFPQMPWDQECSIANTIYAERYVHWDDWEHLYETEWELDWKYDWGKDWIDRLHSAPNCDEEDDASLQALLNKINRRK
ncbi:hypothetical protein B0J11DRAFT_512724 [Dendryphion nanum]|uniref:F-box domain-containing protein n=1 Tax=Dendryphion nanum TaxID=256645 RepID=A0A9P9I7W2_9PLEO|nr:hypothetical protein B0J11DRAFT_512724 [Dendryphion nanum]